MVRASQLGPWEHSANGATVAKRLLGALHEWSTIPEEPPEASNEWSNRCEERLQGACDER